MLEVTGDRVHPLQDIGPVAHVLDPGPHLVHLGRVRLGQDVQLVPLWISRANTTSRLLADVVPRRVNHEPRHATVTLALCNCRGNGPSTSRKNTPGTFETNSKVPSSTAWSTWFTLTTEP